MPIFRDSRFGLVYGNSEGFSSRLPAPPSAESFRSYCDDLIVSASGWRKIFAASGDEEDKGSDLLPEATVLAGAMALAFLRFFRKTAGRENLTIAVGTDSRPTGPALADAMLRVLIASGAQPRYVAVAAAPEIMAYARMSEGIDGFAYISASHNPVGHNGVKFGLDNGGVLGGAQAAELISIFKKLLTDPTTPETVFELLRACPSGELEQALADTSQNKSDSLAAYSRFSDRVTADSEDQELISKRTTLLRSQVEKRGLGILGELNGSARCASIDEDYFRSLGLRITTINNVPGRIVHRIVPEGSSLDDCRIALEKLHAQDPSFVLGYVPDNDGDRGNLVWFDSRTGKAKEIEAQQLFCLTVAAELCWLVHTGQLSYKEDGDPRTKIAVVVNGPTSLRIEELASKFGATVFRAEVGEANVVNLAQEKRQEGWTVRILGEGSNGGNITHPSAVRDPLNTLCSIAKLLSVPELAAIFADKTGAVLGKEYSLGDLMAALPVYTTTSAYEQQAIMKVRSSDHGRLKAAYEELFPGVWPRIQELLGPSLGVSGWEEINYEGTAAKRGVGAEFRSGAERGGLKIQFLNQSNEPVAYIWMRGSGTEPVFRVLVDLRGNRPELEASLLEIHRSLISKADSSA